MIVVGGPAGSATACYLARAGLDVLVLEKATFPREKVCGDGMTPRAVRALVGMGVPIGEQDGWVRNKGLRIIGGGVRLELPWPELSSYPGYGLVRSRLDFDETLVRTAQQAGARVLEGMTVTSPVLDDAGRIVGVNARPSSPGEGRAAEGGPRRAGDSQGVPGVAPRGQQSPTIQNALTWPGSWWPRTGTRRGCRWPWAWASGTTGRSGWPCARTTPAPGMTTTTSNRGWTCGTVTGCCPATAGSSAWGTAPATSGLGLLNTSASFGNVDYRDLLRRWLAGMPAEWGYVEENRTQPVRGAALPMGFNRTPHYTQGLLLAGDAGGMVNPFNGEGIAYAMEAGELAAAFIAQALARPDAAGMERVLRGYPQALKDSYGGYYTLGRKFVQAIGNPRLMQFATRHGMPRPALMRFTLKLLANLTEVRGGDAADRVIHALSKMTPAA